MLIREQDLSKVTSEIVDVLTSTLDTNLIATLRSELRPFLSKDLQDRLDKRIDTHLNWYKDIDQIYLNMIFNCNKDVISFAREYAKLSDKGKEDFKAMLKSVKQFLSENEDFLEVKKDMFDKIVDKFESNGIDPTPILENRSSIETKYAYNTPIYKLRNNRFIIDAIYEGLIVA